MSGFDQNIPGDPGAPPLPAALKRPWWITDCPRCGRFAECRTEDDGTFGLKKAGPYCCEECGWTEGEPPEEQSSVITLSPSLQRAFRKLSNGD